VSAQAAEPVKLAYSEKLGVTLFAYPDASGQWCRAKLGISILAKDDSPLLSQGIDGMMPKFGAMFAEKCPAATSAAVAVYKASDRSLIGKSFIVAKADNWNRPAESQAVPAPTSTAAPNPAAIVAAASPPEAPPQLIACDHSPAAADYFIAACVARGLEIHRQTEGLEAARTRQADAGKALSCTPQSITHVNDMAMQTAMRIVTSGTISALMDFSDGMLVDCRKAASDQLK
jgi:hypothetical protein